MRANCNKLCMDFDSRREVGVWNPQTVPRSTIFLSSFIETSLVEGENLMPESTREKGQSRVGFQPVL